MKEKIEKLRNEIIPGQSEPLKTVLTLYGEYCEKWSAEEILERDISEVMPLDEDISAMVGDRIYFHKSLEDSLENIINAPDYLQNLTIELTEKEIQKTWDEYGVIPLRPVGNNEKLLLGCGNTPASPLEAAQVGANDGHQHDGYDTLDPSLLINPTVVGAFGWDRGLGGFLPKAHYTVLANEAVTLRENAKFFNDDLFLQCFKKRAYIENFLVDEKEKLMVSEIKQSTSLFWEPDDKSRMIAKD